MTAKITMPLFAYFTRVGAVLVGLLLLADFFFAPNETKPDPAGAAIEEFFSKSRTATALPPVLGSTFRAPVALRPEPERPEPANAIPPNAEPGPTAEADQQPAKQSKPQRKAARAGVKPQRYGASAYSSYAQVRSYYSAENRHAPQ